VGVLAACGLVSLKQMIGRLQSDHANAKLLAEELRKISSLEVSEPFTNMVFVKSRIPGWSTDDLNAAMEKEGILAFAEHPGIRLVTHYGIEREHIMDVAKRMQGICTAGANTPCEVRV
jgi:threonine aldolase